MILDLPIGVARLRDCNLKEWMGISIHIWKSVVTDDVSRLNVLVSLYLSGECGLDLLEEPIALNINENEETSTFAFMVPAFLAIESNSINVLKWIVQVTKNPNARAYPDKYRSRTLLFAAATNGDSNAVQFLIDAGAKVNDVVETIDGDLVTTLDAAIQSKSEKTVGALLDAGAWPTFTSALLSIQHLPSIFVRIININPSLLINRGFLSNRTLMHHVCAMGDIETLHYLHNKGMDINLPDENGCTPLLYATSNNRSEIVEYLKSHGAKDNCLSASTDVTQSKCQPIDAPLTQGNLTSIAAHQLSAPPESNITETDRIQSFVAWLSGQDIISLSKLRDKLVSHDLLPSAVISDINERSLELTGELALEECDGSVVVRREILLQVIVD